MAHADDSKLYAQWHELLTWLSDEAQARRMTFDKVADFPDYVYRMERTYDLPTTVMSVSMGVGNQPLLVASVSPRHAQLKGVAIRIMGGSKHLHFHAGETTLMEGKRPLTRERLGVLLDGIQKSVA